MGVGVNGDITERKIAEVAVCESEERLARELAATQQLPSLSALVIEGPGTLPQKITDAAAVIMGSRRRRHADGL
jgi:hypothetical protein